jgi:hypothetical protein
MLKDLSLIALTYSRQSVQQRLPFKPNPKGENSAPVVFQHDALLYSWYSGTID